MPIYAQPSDMLNCFDAGILGDACSDNGIQISEEALPTDPKLLSALARASGEVEAACLFGAMYTIADLQGLTDNALALLVDLVCSIAMCKLLKRRPVKDAGEMFEGVCGDARQQLEAIREGKAVFAGTPDATSGQLLDTTGISTIQVNQLNMWRDQTRNYFPNRNLPNGQ